MARTRVFVEASMLLISRRIALGRGHKPQTGRGRSGLGRAQTGTSPEATFSSGRRMCRPQLRRSTPGLHRTVLHYSEGARRDAGFDPRATGPSTAFSLQHGRIANKSRLMGGRRFKPAWIRVEAYLVSGRARRTADAGMVRGHSHIGVLIFPIYPVGVCSADAR